MADTTVEATDLVIEYAICLYGVSILLTVSTGLAFDPHGYPEIGTESLRNSLVKSPASLADGHCETTILVVKSNHMT